MRLLFILCIIGIVYGSLYPFTFVPFAQGGDSIIEVLAAWNEVPSRGDVFGNLFLFVPYGLIGAFVLARRPLVIGGLVLAAVVQVVQFWVAYRAPQVQDVFWNMLGMAAGMAAAALPMVRRAVENPDRSRLLSPATLLIGVWFLAVAAPFVPTIDYAAYRNALKPLLLNPAFDAAGTFQIMAVWLAIGCMVAALWSDRRSQRLVLVGLVGFAFLLKIVIVRNVITLPDALGVSVAAVLWLLVVERVPHRDWIVAVLLLGSFVWSGLEPFILREVSARFYWLPFTGAMYGPMLAQTKDMLAHLFVIGAPIWLLTHRAHQLGTIVAVTVGVALLALTTELAQVYIAGRTPESTFAVMALLVGGLLAVRHHMHPTNAQTATPERAA